MSSVYLHLDKVDELIVYNTAHCFILYLLGGLNSESTDT